MIALVLRMIEAFKVFDIVWVMTRGGPANTTRTLSILVYQEAFSFQRAGSGAALRVLLAVGYLQRAAHPARRSAQDQDEQRGNEANHRAGQGPQQSQNHRPKITLPSSR